MIHPYYKKRKKERGLQAGRLSLHMYVPGKQRLLSAVNFKVTEARGWKG